MLACFLRSKYYVREIFCFQMETRRKNKRNNLSFTSCLLYHGQMGAPEKVRARSAEEEELIKELTPSKKDDQQHHLPTYSALPVPLSPSDPHLVSTTQSLQRSASILQDNSTEENLVSLGGSHKKESLRRRKAKNNCEWGGCSECCWQ